MRTHEVVVLTEHFSPVSDRPYTKVWVYESEQIARVEMLDMRAYSPQLWLQAPEGYLGPCLVLVFSYTLTRPKRVPKRFGCAADARAFTAKCPMHTLHGRHYGNPSPILAPPHEIELWKKETINLAREEKKA